MNLRALFFILAKTIKFTTKKKRIYHDVSCFSCNAELLHPKRSEKNCRAFAWKDHIFSRFPASKVKLALFAKAIFQFPTVL